MSNYNKIASNSSPIVWVGDFPYKIKMKESSNKHALLCQMSVRVNYKNNGKETYLVINRRMVKLYFQ